MKIINSTKLLNTDRQVDCPNGGFTSFRMLLEEDGMGFTMTKTVIQPNGPQHWHYKEHLEACYCIEGTGAITNIESGEEFRIAPGILYVLDKYDDHTFEAITPVVLLCVFNPPLKGREVHDAEGSYNAGE